MDAKFKELLSEKPTILWRERLYEDLADEDIDKSEIKYSDDLLQKTDALIDEFISRLANLNEPNRSNILLIVKNFVLQLNDLTRNNNFIETGEREDLCDFIDSAVSLAGLNLDPDEDISLEWRQW